LRVTPSHGGVEVEGRLASAQISVSVQVGDIGWRPAERLFGCRGIRPGGHRAVGEAQDVVAVVFDRQGVPVPLFGQLWVLRSVAEEGDEVAGRFLSDAWDGVVDLAGNCGVDDGDLLSNRRVVGARRGRIEESSTGFDRALAGGKVLTGGVCSELSLMLGGTVGPRLEAECCDPRAGVLVLARGC